MPSQGARTPAAMIMTGIMQQRQFFDISFQHGDFYSASRYLYDVYCLLPKEAQDKVKIDLLPSVEKTAQTITPDIQRTCRAWIDKHRAPILMAIPQYVYDFFERGKRQKYGY